MWHETLGLRWPLIQAPMAGVQDHRLAVAVSQAGALGSIPAAMLTPAALDEQLSAVRAAGVEAINVNFFCHTPAPRDEAVEAAWRGKVAAFAKSLGLPDEPPAPMASREPFGQAMLEVLQIHRPAVVSFHFGLPTPALCAAVKTTGAQIWSSATTVDEACWLQAEGVDAVIAQGLEAGGHRGHFIRRDLDCQLSTLDLVSAIKEVWGQRVNVPVLAAGGLSDAAAIERVMRAGASGVQVGTAFLCTREATTSAVHRRALRSRVADGHGGAQVPATVLTNVFTGRAARGIANGATRELGPMADDAPAFAHAALAWTPWRALAERAGSAECTPLWSGTASCAWADVEAADVVQALAAGLAA